MNYSLIGSNEDEIVFDYSNYVLNPDFTGFGIPTSQVRIEASAGDGGVFRHAKRGVRNVDVSITTLGTDRADVQTKLRRLSRILQNSIGPITLRASYSNGESLDLFLYYTGGAESQWGSDAGMIWNRWGLSFQAPNPFWQSSVQESFEIGTGSTGRGLLPELTKLKVSSSQTLGVVTVDNQGDVPAYPIWTISGPVTDLVISDGTNSFGFAEILPGVILTINTEDASVVDQFGENQYPLLEPAPKLFRLQPGVSTISVIGEADPGFSASLSYSPRYEVVH